ncbi:MAG TPA: hypothetical protein VGD56_01880, partial [Gemmatirosa sp.]
MLAACAVGASVARSATAQRVPPPALATSGPAVGPYERARRLVEQGQGALGRAVADSLVAASPPGSPALAEALWWRATLGTDGARAEQDLRRIIDEFANSPRVGDATVRIAQLDLARDRPDLAEPALARLVRERPDDPARAQAAYWLARARLELGDTRGGCVALADAATWARSSETYTRQQVADLRGRLPACDPTSVVSVMPSGSPTVSVRTPASATPSAAPSAPQVVAAAPSARATPPTTTSSTSASSTTPTPNTATHSVMTPNVAPPSMAPPHAASPNVASSNATSQASRAVAPSVAVAQHIDSTDAAERRRRNAVVTAAPVVAAPAAAAPAATAPPPHAATRTTTVTTLPPGVPPAASAASEGGASF